jgi:hypothetical protein
MSDKKELESSELKISKCFTEDDIKEKIRTLSHDADRLTKEMIEIDTRKGQIQERLIQLVGAISVLNSLLHPPSQD